MAEDCCKLVGNLNLNLEGCIISVNVSGKTEVNVSCGEPLPGPTTGTVSLTGYADTTMFVGCPGRAGVSIPWVRKYDCENNKVYFIFSGEGSSFIEGDADRFVTLNQTLNRTFKSINASSSSGPQSIYMETTHVDGYGLTYDGNPISFTTDPEGTIIPNFGVGEGDMYLQNFSLEANPGSLPTASYSFVFTMEV